MAEGVSDGILAKQCKEQLKGWFGDSVDGWEFLRSYRIKHSQPGQAPPNGAEFEKRPEVSFFVVVVPRVPTYARSTSEPRSTPHRWPRTYTWLGTTPAPRR